MSETKLPLKEQIAEKLYRWNCDEPDLDWFGGEVNPTVMERYRDQATLIVSLLASEQSNCCPASRREAIHAYQMGRGDAPCPDSCGGDCTFSWHHMGPCGHTATCEWARHKTNRAVMPHDYESGK